MIVRELLVGRRPFEEMLDASIATAIMLRGVDLSEVEDPRMRLLCRGLLTRDPDDRWGAAQVTDWLAGGSPPVADSGSAQDGVTGLPFAGKTYKGRPQLARALAGNWELAARRYFAMMGSHDNPSEGWRALREWLGRIREPVDRRPRVAAGADRPLAAWARPRPTSSCCACCGGWIRVSRRSTAS